MKTRHSEVDKDLVEAIEGGGYELTDERFFELLEESSDYLGTEPFLNRIIEWQKQLIGDLDWEKQLAENLGEDFQETKRIEDSKKAKEKLQLIGTTLTLRCDVSKPGPGRPKQLPPDFMLAGIFEDYEKLLGDFVERSKKLEYLHDRKKLFEKEFPEWDFVDPYREKDCRTASSLARRVLAAKYKIPRTKLRTLIKDGKKILERTSAVYKSHPKHKSK